MKDEEFLKVIWSFGKRPEIFRENSRLFDFHLKAYYVCCVCTLTVCNIFVELEHFILFNNFDKYHNFIYYRINQ